MEYNYPAFGYLNANREQIFNGPGAGGRLLSMHAAAAKPTAGNGSITIENFNNAKDYLKDKEDDIKTLRLYYNQAAVNDIGVLNSYKDLCLGLREKLGLVANAFQVIKGDVNARIACPQDNVQMVTDMIMAMRRAAGYGAANVMNQGPPAHIEDIVEQATQIQELYMQQYPKAVFDENFRAEILDAPIQLRTPLGLRGNKQIGPGIMSLWTTAYLALNRQNNDDANKILAAILIMKAKGIQDATRVENQINQALNPGLGQNRFAQISNIDHVFNLYFWFFEMCKNAAVENPGFALFREFLDMVENIYFFVIGKQKLMQLLRSPDVGGRTGTWWINYGNQQASLYQAPWNPNITRLRYITLFIPTRNNRQINPPTLNMCADVGLLNIKRDSQVFWAILLSIYMTEQLDQNLQVDRYSSLHILHRLIVGAKSPFHNTQFVNGNALNVQVVAFNAQPGPIPQNQQPQAQGQQGNITQAQQPQNFNAQNLIQQAFRNIPNAIPLPTVPRQAQAAAVNNGNINNNNNSNNSGNSGNNNNNNITNQPQGSNRNNAGVTRRLAFNPGSLENTPAIE